jgi:hypothetical protein
LIDEVRAIRRTVCDEFDNDVARLCSHLREVDREYESRTGRFAGLFTLTNEEVIAGWGPEVESTDDPLIDEVRAIRRARGKHQT